MRSITSPAPDSFVEASAEAGFELFYGKANCSSCHSTPDLTGSGLYKVTATDPAGGLAGGIHVPSLRGIASIAHYFHDSSAATLTDAINQLIAKTSVSGVPALTLNEIADLVEYLKSL
ncbi:MAG: c-type cytochrome [Gammaproteobacteria bacterium]|nr:c-type cytochrome [Gammaproteobacteria bacterium]MBL6999286.1 c-type cytochrome [Gammaproteobacteria bacterium]